MRSASFAVCLLCLVTAFHRTAMAEKVTATWYDLPGRLMANGKMFQSGDATIAAGGKANFGKTLLVTNPKNGKTITVMVSDRLPEWNSYKHLDLSIAAARELGYVNEGKIRALVRELPKR